MNDDLYPTSSDTYEDNYYAPPVDEERIQAEQDEKAIKAASYPILADIAEWFESRINECDSIDQIQLDKMTVNGVVYERLVSIEGQLLAQRLLKTALTEKYEQFKEFKREN